MVPARSAADGAAAIGSDPLIGALIIDADLDQSGGAEAVLRAFRARKSSRLLKNSVHNDKQKFCVTSPSSSTRFDGVNKIEQERRSGQGSTPNYMLQDVSRGNILLKSTREGQSVCPGLRSANYVRKGFSAESPEGNRVVDMSSVSCGELLRMPLPEALIAVGWIADAAVSHGRNQSAFL